MLSVKCSECYVKGTAYATLTFDTDFNISSALSQFISEFSGEVSNITTEVWDEFEDWAQFVYDNSTDVILTDIEAAVTFDCALPSLSFSPSNIQLLLEAPLRLS